jgi:hypothetical protein
MTNASDLRAWLSRLHDSQLIAFLADYEREVVELRFRLHPGMSTEAPAEDEARPTCRMVVSGLRFCVVEPPDDVSLLKGFGSPFIDSAGVGVPSTTRWPVPEEPPVAVRVWLYVSTWNAFIQIAGEHIEFHESH